MSSYQLATAQESTPVRRVGGEFYQATKYDINIPSDATQMILSSKSGGTGDIYVDDRVVIIATTDDNTSATYDYDFSGGCSGKVTPTKPVNLFNTSGFTALKGNYISVQIQFWDKCGTVQSGSNFFLTIS